MSSGYPSNQDEAGEWTASLGDSLGTRHGQALSGLEIAIIVTTVASFLLVVFFVFYCRRVDQRRRATHGARRAEEGRAGDTRPQRVSPATVVPQLAKSHWWTSMVEKYRTFSQLYTYFRWNRG